MVVHHRNNQKVAYFFLIRSNKLSMGIPSAYREFHIFLTLKLFIKPWPVKVQLNNYAKKIAIK